MTKKLTKQFSSTSPGVSKVERSLQTLKEAMDYLLPLVKQAGEMAFANWEKIEIKNYKDSRDLVTKIEPEIENFLKKKIISKWPTHGFWGEETERINISSPFQWLVDPIDGTKYYVYQAPFFFVHVALLFKGEPVLGLIYNPVSKQLFSALKDNGAYLNNKLISLRPPVSLGKAIIDVNLGGLGNKGQKEKNWMTGKLNKILEKSYRVRITGGALNIYLVTGASDAHIDFASSKPQDLFPRLIIMQEAGYKVEWIETPFSKKVPIVSREPILSKLKEILSK